MEARGYTAWNPASPVFIVERAARRTLCIPSVFIGYHGEALDEMTPLLRSSDASPNKAIELLELLGDKGVQRVYTTLGAEQEYFLIDRGHFALRPDLVMAGRTLVGAPPPRGQQLEDHYFGGIPERVQACIAEVEHELYKLGVPIVTRHNEVAPVRSSRWRRCSRRRTSPSTTTRWPWRRCGSVALRHGLQALLHEKPFAGINGSGKHCNWSHVDRRRQPELDGVNLLEPGKTPHQNIRFLVFLAAVLKGVHQPRGPAARRHRHVSGNEHRLGANEAPPAIISVFMGADAHGDDRVRSPRARRRRSAAQAMIKLGVAKLPEIEKDNTDRNRTSPFAFTGNKFEFRAVGSSAVHRVPDHAAQRGRRRGDRRDDEQLAATTKRTKPVDDAVLAVVREAFQETARRPLRGQQLLRGVGQGGREARPAEPAPHPGGARRSWPRVGARRCSPSSASSRRRSSSRATMCASSAT